MSETYPEPVAFTRIFSYYFENINTTHTILFVTLNTMLFCMKIIPSKNHTHLVCKTLMCWSYQVTCNRSTIQYNSYMEVKDNSKNNVNRIDLSLVNLYKMKTGQLVYPQGRKFCRLFEASSMYNRSTWCRHSMEYEWKINEWLRKQELIVRKRFRYW